MKTPKIKVIADLRQHCIALAYIVSLSALGSAADGLEPIPDKLVVLTFDDSCKSRFTTVLPILKRYGFRATFFIIHTRRKLRFRRAGRQMVRHIRSPADAKTVAAELAKLQSGRRLRRQLAELNREASALFRQTKIRLQPIVEVTGLKFHGRQIRRPRRPNDERRG